MAIARKDNIAAESHINSFIVLLINEVSKSGDQYALPVFKRFSDNVSFLNNTQLTLDATCEQPFFAVVNSRATHSAPTTKPAGWWRWRSAPSTVVAAVQCIVKIAKQSRLIAIKEDRKEKSQAGRELQAALEKLRKLAGVAAPAVKK
jgi:hypothetical protein